MRNGAPEEVINALVDEVETWKRKFRMADQNRRVRQKKADKPKHPQPNRLSFSVSREEAKAVIKAARYGANNATLLYGLDLYDRGAALHFVAKLERALARGDRLGKEGK